MNRWVQVCCAAALPVQVFAASQLSHFNVDLSYNLKNDGGVAELPGRLYAPAGIPEGEKRPLVVFLHGQDERGTDNMTQVNTNITGLYEAAAARGFYVYAPQLPVTASSWSSSYLDMTLGMVARATQTYSNIDTSKLYVTGLSLGGGGTKLAITNYRDTFAAAVPVSGTSPSGVDPASLVGKPIWAVHAANDTRVLVGESRNFVNSIRQAEAKPPLTFPLAGNTGSPYYPYDYVNPEAGTTTPVAGTYYEQNNLRYSETTGGGHTTTFFVRTYRESWIYDWMLAQSNPLHKPQLNEKVMFDLGDTALTGADSQGRTWNSALADEEVTTEVAIPFAKLSNGSRTSINLTVADKFNGRATRGITSGSLYSAAIAQDTWTVSSGDPGSILLDGLTPGGEYRISIFGSDSDSDGGLGRMTRYTVGDEFRDLQIYNNLSGTALFESVVADSVGQLTLGVSVAPGSGSRFGGIGAIEITAVPEPVSGLLVSGALAFLVGRRSRGSARGRYDARR